MNDDVPSLSAVSKSEITRLIFQYKRPSPIGEVTTLVFNLRRQKQVAKALGGNYSVYEGCEIHFATAVAEDELILVTELNQRIPIALPPARKRTDELAYITFEIHPNSLGGK